MQSRLVRPVKRGRNSCPVKPAISSAVWLTSWPVKMGRFWVPRLTHRQIPDSDPPSDARALRSRRRGAAQHPETDNRANPASKTAQIASYARIRTLWRAVSSFRFSGFGKKRDRCDTFCHFRACRVGRAERDRHCVPVLDRAGAISPQSGNGLEKGRGCPLKNKIEINPFVLWQLISISIFQKSFL